MSEQYNLELIRSYASSGFAAVITINSGALIGGLSQADNLDVFSPAAIAIATFIWALGVATGVATWGAAYRGVVALASSDQRKQMRWRGVATGLFHVSLCMSCSALRSSAWRSRPSLPEPQEINRCVDSRRGAAGRRQRR